MEGTSCSKSKNLSLQQEKAVAGNGYNASLNLKDRIGLTDVPFLKDRDRFN